MAEGRPRRKRHALQAKAPARAAPVPPIEPERTGRAGNKRKTRRVGRSMAGLEFPTEPAAPRPVRAYGAATDEWLGSPPGQVSIPSDGRLRPLPGQGSGLAPGRGWGPARRAGPHFPFTRRPPPLAAASPSASAGALNVGFRPKADIRLTAAMGHFRSFIDVPPVPEAAVSIDHPAAEDNKRRRLKHPAPPVRPVTAPAEPATGRL